jgi:UDP-N-acetylmuramoyl-L-alanyl-D-glutamate--2,6-diaminopimelate ligase
MDDFIHSNKFAGIAFDSRDVRENWLFVALVGTVVDGHDFIPAAIQAGASAIIAQHEIENSPVPVLVVPDTRAALAQASAAFYNHPAGKMKLIGVTGTNGKTSVTYFIDEILRACGVTTGLIGTVGARVGDAAGVQDIHIPIATSTTPDPPQLHAIFAEMLARGVTHVVMEVSSHALALLKMETLTFDVGVFTNLTQDHLDFHGTMDNYRHAKAKLFSQSRFAVVNADSDSTPVMLQYHGDDPFSTFGIDNKSDLQATSIKYNTEFTTFSAGGQHYNLPVKGRFSVYNALAAIGVAQRLGLPHADIARAVSNLAGVPGRIQSVPNMRGVHVLVDYAHSPDGLANIIPAVREFCAGKLVTLFGCSGDRDREKRPIMGRIAARGSDHVIITSDNPRTENPTYIIEEIATGVRRHTTPYDIYEDRAQAIRAGIAMLSPGDALIIAGKGHEDYQIIGDEKKYFSDYQLALQILEESQ